MATSHKEFVVDVPHQFAWDAVRDVGEVHSRLAVGFAARAVLEGSVRTVTFANGFVYLFVVAAGGLFFVAAFFGG